MTRIAIIPWVRGSRDPWKGEGYTAARVRWCVDRLVTAAPTLPVYVVTPHVDEAEALGPARVIDCSRFLKRTGLVKCGVMAAMFHPDLEHLDLDGITADTLVLRDPREVMPLGSWWASEQHARRERPYGDWFSHYPARHPIRAACLRHFTTHPGTQDSFDKWMVKVAYAHRLAPKCLVPPVIINGGWIYEGWEGLCQPLTAETAAVHPHTHTKWPEMADTHPYFAHLPSLFSRPVPAVSWPALDVPAAIG